MEIKILGTSFGYCIVDPCFNAKGFYIVNSKINIRLYRFPLLFLVSYLKTGTSRNLKDECTYGVEIDICILGFVFAISVRCKDKSVKNIEEVSYYRTKDRKRFLFPKSALAKIGCIIDTT